MPKTILLQCKNHPFVLWECNIQITNPLHTFYECISNRLQTRCERFTNNVIPTHETPQNTPPGVGADSSCPYPNITKNAYSHYQICISHPHYVCVYVYADTINRPLQLLTAANYVANTLQNTQRTPTKCLTNTPPGVGDRFIVPVS